MRYFFFSLCIFSLTSGGLCQPLSGEWNDSSGEDHAGKMETAVFQTPQWGREIVRVYRPPGYDDSPNARYPALYVLDGQNVFQNGGDENNKRDWQFDEVVDEMITGGELRPLLVVTVDHPQDRSGAYTARRIWRPESHGVPAHEEGGQADDYVGFLDRVRQTVDQRYRTNGDNGLLGSSLGGVFALHVGLTPGAGFNRVAAMSPSLWWYGRPGIGELFPKLPQQGPQRLWLDMGEAEEAPPSADIDVELARSTAEWLNHRLADTTRVGFDSFRGHTHSEKYWHERLPQVLMFLYEN